MRIVSRSLGLDPGLKRDFDGCFVVAKTLYNDKGRGDLDPDDHNLFQTQRRQANQAYNLGSAQNKYRRSTYDQNYAAQTGDLRRQYRDARNSFGSDWTQRGLLNSGLYRQAYGQLQGQRQQAAADLLRQYQQQKAGTDLAGRQLSTIRSDAFADVAAAEAARRQSVAAALRLAKEQG